jgi:hypothetical protein
VGAGTLDLNTTGIYNTAFGTAALDANVAGNKNTAVGYGSLGKTTQASDTDNSNTAVGYKAGAELTSGIGNVFIGFGAGDDSTTCDHNTCVGYLAGGNAATTGDDNTCVGVSAGQNLTTGANNLLLGHDAGITGSPGGNINNENNEIVLGDENISEAHIQVDWSVHSDERDKTDFTDLDIGLDFVKALAPVTYKWDKRSKYIDKHDPDVDLNKVTHDGTHKEDWLDIGFKAQEVEKLELAAGYKIADKTNLTTSLSGDGAQYSLKYTKFVPILVKAIQELSAEVEKLKGG